jgi:hypothetical protein
MQWTVLETDVHLVILGNDGTQYLFPYLPRTDGFLGPSIEAGALKAHPLEPTMTEPYRRGVLTCREGVIVSTTGHDIVGRHVTSSQNPGISLLHLYIHISSLTVSCKGTPKSHHVSTIRPSNTQRPISFITLVDATHLVLFIRQKM